jgi:diguanylate cyclase (GGDEF)-like protein/PAS domain S-box-containing protein
MPSLHALWDQARRCLRAPWSPATRVAGGLVALMMAMILMADLFTGFLPDRLQEARRLRMSQADSVVAPVTAALSRGSTEELPAVLAASLRQQPQLRSAAIQTRAGETLASAGPHARHWHLPADARSTLDNLRVALRVNGQPWGELQLAFEPALPQGLAGGWSDPLWQGLALVSALGFMAFQLYLRRVLRYLDPNSAVPERVRTAFDTLTEGVLVLDPQGRIMLANRAFMALVPPGSQDLSGRNAATLPWFTAGLPTAPMLPWLQAVRDGRPVTGLSMQVDTATAGARRLVLNCSPIDDGAGRVRGCLASVSDVTELHERTQSLRLALDELHASQRVIEAKNEALMRQATRDPLTGCLNRRALMQEIERAFEVARHQHQPLCCVMCDIDHFKSINDQFGHASGDMVIQSAVKSLSRGLRVGDLLGRYGGEEFCILLVNSSAAQALEVAERLRADIEAHVSGALRQPARPKVTMSFGVAPWVGGADTPAALIDRADQALYRSKHAGRNRVTPYADEATRPDPPPA